MSHDAPWWDSFWRDKIRTRIGLGPADDATWFGLVWRVALEQLSELFDRRAPGKDLLECGCGSARVSRHMASAGGYRCTMVDYSRAAIQVAVENFASAGLAGRFVVGDLRGLSFSDGRFDVAYCGGVLEFFPDPGQPIREMVRVLKPGGLFAANIVPRKFSIQSIADIERTVAYSLGNAARGRFKDALKISQSVPRNYGVSRAPLDAYLDACREAGLESVAGFAVTPFPALAMPKAGQKLYGRLLAALLPSWRRFNRSRGRWAKTWGLGYLIYGVKGTRPS